MSSIDHVVAGIILAAGLGTRMKSDMAKVLHPVAGKAMIHYAVETALRATSAGVVVVLGHQAGRVRDEVSCYPELRFAVQSEQLGTGHAALCALPELPSHAEHVVILCGDSPLLRPNSLRKLIEDHILHQYDVTVLAFEMHDPRGYGRLILDATSRVIAIKEETDANSREKEIKIVNSGIYCVTKNFLQSALQRIGADNAQGEYYLTDIVQLANIDNRSVGMHLGLDNLEFLGVNTLDELHHAEMILEARRSKTA